MAHTRHRQTAPVPLGELLTPGELSRRLSIPETTLTDWRYRGRGPAYVRVGRLVRYPTAMLDAWLAARLRGGGADGDEQRSAG